MTDRAPERRAAEGICLTLPVSYSTVESIQHCPRRYIFSQDVRMPTRLDPRARLGTAFHEALAKAILENLAIDSAIDLFDRLVRRQLDEAGNNQREKDLTWPKSIQQQLENALAARLMHSTRKCSLAWKDLVEYTVVSGDGVLAGRIDALRRDGRSVEIVDYKTGSFSDEVLLRHRKQVVFYAGLWLDSRDERVTHGVLDYVLCGHVDRFSIEVEECKRVLQEARDIVAEFGAGGARWTATPNEGCQHCPYRPWCDDYWMPESAVYRREGDVQGTVCMAHPPDGHAFCIANSEGHRSVVNKVRKPLPCLRAGALLRVLDLSPGNRHYACTSRTEIFGNYPSGTLACEDWSLVV